MKKAIILLLFISSFILAEIALKSKKLKISGDYRFRFEDRDTKQTGETDKSKDRLRQRLRLGLSFEVDKNLSAYLGFASGGSSATSTNQTFSNNSEFDSGDLRIDYAFVKHIINNESSLSLGQQKNPYKTTGYFFDSDIRPAGITYTFKRNALTLNFGSYVTKYASGSDGNMLAMQALYKVAKSTNLAIGLFSLNSTAVKQFTAGSKVEVDPQGAWNISPFEIDTSKDNIVEDNLVRHPDNVRNENNLNTVNGKFGWNILNFNTNHSMKVNDMKLKFLAELSMNLDADGKLELDDDKTLNLGGQNTALILGAELGMKDFKVGLQIVDLGAGSLHPSFASSDFGGKAKLNIKGTVFKLGYKISKQASVDLTIANESEKENISNLDSETLMQLDFKYKF